MQKIPANGRFGLVITALINCTHHCRVKKNRVFLKKPNPVVFWVLWVFLDKQEKIGKIIQKLSNLKP